MCFSKSSNFFEIHAKKNGRRSHACRGLCACAYSRLLPPGGLPFPSLQKFTFPWFYCGQCQAWPSGAPAQQTLSFPPPPPETREKAAAAKLAMALARTQKLAVYALGHERRSLSAATATRAAAGMGSPWDEPAASFCSQRILCHCRLREIKASGRGIYRPRNPSPHWLASSWRRCMQQIASLLLAAACMTAWISVLSAHTHDRLHSSPFSTV